MALSLMEKGRKMVKGLFSKEEKQSESDRVTTESSQYEVRTDEDSNFILSHKDNPEKQVVLV